jgi:MFS-type transporter involved in bile tolerance (Atg22 family)
MPLAGCWALGKAGTVISALILFVAFGLVFKAWNRARRSGKPFLLQIEPTAKERSLMILGGTMIAVSSVPMMLLVEHLLPGMESVPVAIVTVYLLLGAWGLIVFFAKRQKTRDSDPPEDPS